MAKISTGDRVCGWQCDECENIILPFNGTRLRFCIYCGGSNFRSVFVFKPNKKAFENDRMLIRQS